MTQNPFLKFQANNLVLHVTAIKKRSVLLANAAGHLPSPCPTSSRTRSKFAMIITQYSQSLTKLEMYAVESIVVFFCFVMGSLASWLHLPTLRDTMRDSDGNCRLG